MPNIHLTDSEVTYLHSLLCCVQDRHLASVDEALLFESTIDQILALSSKVEKLQFSEDRDKNCRNCGAVITSPNPRKITCSDACRQAWSRTIKRAKTAAAL